MSEQERVQPGSALTARQDFLRALWEEHVRYTFATRNTEDTLNTIAMDWMLPGIAPPGRRVEIPLVAIVRFREGKLAHEHIYWDQATSVLVQLGLLDAGTLPVAGVETARKALDPTL